MNELKTPTWDNVKTECDVLEQMASQTVLKACDIGDMLRQIRATMEPGKFYAHCTLNLSRGQQWADRMMLLSFRRPALVKVLSDGAGKILFPL